MRILITRGHTETGFHGWRIWEIVGKHSKTGRPLVMDWESLHPTAQSALDRITNASRLLQCYPVSVSVEPTTPRWAEAE